MTLPDYFWGMQSAWRPPDGWGGRDSEKLAQVCQWLRVCLWSNPVKTASEPSFV